MPNRDLLVRQIIAAMLQNRPFPPPSPLFRGWTPESVASVLAAIPRYFFHSPRSIGRQSASSRHRSPLRQRNLRRESHLRPLGPAAHTDSPTVSLGLSKALEFYSWLESHSFTHTPLTAREMARLVAKSNRLPPLWRFLRRNSPLITTPTVTAVIHILGQSGLVNEALAAFHRMRQFHCKPDTVSYNTVISALARIGDFKRARFLLEQMEFPGARCPPDIFTYTILIAAYCKYSLQTGCRKAITRRIWEASHMYRRMLFRGFAPDIVTFNCLINGFCKTYRIERAHELFDEMIKRGCMPNKVTYNSFIRYYSAVNEVDRAIEMMREMAARGHGMPTNSTYTPIVHSLCEVGRVKEARDVLVEMVDGGNVPREFTFKMVAVALEAAGEEGLPEELRRRVEDAIDARFTRLMWVKPLLKRRDGLVEEDE